MLTPLFVGVSFFLYSAISGFMTISQVQMPENFDEVSIKLKNYDVSQIDEKTGKVKWKLKADRIETNPDETKAKMIKPLLKYFEPEFNIVADFALLDKVNQSVELFDNVDLETKAGEYQIAAKKMFFSEANENILFEENWHLSSKRGFTLSGSQGLVKKDFSYVKSNGNALLRKIAQSQTMLLSAQLIELQPEAKESIKASGLAELDISATQKLKAEKIQIHQDGTVFAEGQVNVKAENIDCYSDKLTIPMDGKQKPSIAVFSGEPHIIQNNKLIYADLIKYDFKTKLVSFEGHVHSGSI